MRAVRRSVPFPVPGETCFLRGIMTVVPAGKATNLGLLVQTRGPGASCTPLWGPRRALVTFARSKVTRVQGAATWSYGEINA